MASYTRNGRRYVLEGDTRSCPKGSLGKYGIGMRFDRDTCTWWTGREEVAQRAVAWVEECTQLRAQQNTYRKVGDAWCVHCPTSVEVGAQITVTKRDGTTRRETVASVLERCPGGGVIVTVQRARATRTAGNRRRRPARGRNGECRCGGCDDLLSIGYRPGERVRCDECGGWADAC